MSKKEPTKAKAKAAPKKAAAKAKPAAEAARNPDHWVADEANRSKFWAEAAKLGLNDDAVHAALGVESVYGFQGTMEAALGKLRAHVLMDTFVPRAEAMPSAPMWASTRFNFRGYDVTVSIQGGYLRAEMAAWRRELMGALVDLVNACNQDDDIHPLVDGRYQPGQKKAATADAKAAGKAPPPPPPPGATTGPPAGDAPPVAGDPEPQVPPEATAEPVEFVRITAPKGKPVIEFWRPGRQYPEISFYPSAEQFFAHVEGADALLEAGWTVEHFEAVGADYALPLVVHWVPSAKNPRWRDIVRVEMR